MRFFFCAEFFKKTKIKNRITFEREMRDEAREK